MSKSRPPPSTPPSSTYAGSSRPQTTPTDGTKSSRFDICEDASAERKIMWGEINGRIVHGMPVREFVDLLPLNSNLPRPEFTGKEFQGLPQAKFVINGKRKHAEANLYDDLATIIGNLLGPDFVVKVTAEHADKNSTKDRKFAPDLIAYLKANENKLIDNITDFSLAEIMTEVKVVDLGKDAKIQKKTLAQREAHQPLKSGEQGRDNVSQICLALAEQSSRQFRTHAFHVFYSNDVARLIRQDRAGIIISNAIHYRKDSKLLEEFYYRYGHASPEERGHDPSVRLANDAETILAQSHLEPPKHHLHRDVYVIRVPVELSRPETGPATAIDGPSKESKSIQQDEKALEPVYEIRDVLAWGSFSEIRCLTGRTPRAMVVFDPTKNEKLFLKDTWRADVEDMDKEGDILKRLNARGVPHVPKLISGADVAGAHGRTITQNYIDAAWRTGKICDISPRVHHRLLEKIIPKRIDDYENPKQMLQCVGQALIAHERALQDCGILHRDVTPNNIMIDENGEGVLTDWDLAVQIRDLEGNPILRTCPRQSHRTVTWAFVSLEILRDTSKIPDVKDDVESFFWIILYLSLAYLPFTTKRATSFPFLKATIFKEDLDIGSEKEGGRAKREVLRGEAELEALDFTDNGALTDWFNNARDGFDQLRSYNMKLRRATQSGTSPNANPIPEELISHQFLTDLITSALAIEDGWTNNKLKETNDPIRFNLRTARRGRSVPERAAGKRQCPTILEEEEDEEGDASQPHARPRKRHDQGDRSGNPAMKGSTKAKSAYALR